MKRNIFYLQQRVSGSDFEKTRNDIIKVLENFEKIYSYTVSVERSELVMYLIRYAISEDARCNTITRNDALNGIMNAIEKDRDSNGKYIIGHGQPPLDLLITLYEPLICKLANDQKQRWKILEYDDLCQMCRLTLIILYNKGYYIHKHLLEKAFNNDVLHEISGRMDFADTLSLETKMRGNDELEKLTLKDTIEDVYENEKREDENSMEIMKNIFSEVKDIIVDEIGVRQFEQLYGDYANGHTTAWSRRKMQSIKNKFKVEGLTLDKFINKYGN